MISPWDSGRGIRSKTAQLPTVPQSTAGAAALVQAAGAGWARGRVWEGAAGVLEAGKETRLLRICRGCREAERLRLLLLPR